jgi:hypothetical protein
MHWYLLAFGMLALLVASAIRFKSAGNLFTKKTVHSDKMSIEGASLLSSVPSVLDDRRTLVDPALSNIHKVVSACSKRNARISPILYDRMRDL